MWTSKPLKWKLCDINVLLCIEFLIVLFSFLSEVAFGYKGLKILLYYIAGNLSTLFRIEYTSKVNEKFDCVEVKTEPDLHLKYYWEGLVVIWTRILGLVIAHPNVIYIKSKQTKLPLLLSWKKLWTSSIHFPIVPPWTAVPSKLCQTVQSNMRC